MLRKFRLSGAHFAAPVAAGVPVDWVWRAGAPFFAARRSVGNTDVSRKEKNLYVCVFSAAFAAVVTASTAEGPFCIVLKVEASEKVQCMVDTPHSDG